jgi:hypothetical protein
LVPLRHPSPPRSARPGPRRWALATAFGALLASGCEEGLATHLAYEGCPAGDPLVFCDAALTCLDVDVEPRATGFCSATCARDADCPADALGRPVVCAEPIGASRPLCHVDCAVTGACPAGTACVELLSPDDTPIALCLPAL